jgi:hypothetical protein
VSEPTNYRVIPASRPISRQLRLFAPVGMRKKAHQRTLEEFADMPGTMFHGTAENPLRQTYRKTGFHVGTRRAAEDRLGQTRGGDWTVEDDFHVHPVRIKPGVMITDPDERIRDRVKEWGPAQFRKHYKNEFEDPGSTSAILKSTRDVRTYTQHAEEALKRGGIPSGEAEYHLQQRQRTGEEPTLKPSWMPERLVHRPFTHQGEMIYGTEDPGHLARGGTPSHINPQAAAPEHEHEASQWLPRWAENQSRKGVTQSRQFGG